MFLPKYPSKEKEARIKRQFEIWDNVIFFENDR